MPIYTHQDFHGFFDRMWPSAGGDYDGNELAQSTAGSSRSLTVLLIWHLVKGVLKLPKHLTMSSSQMSPAFGSNITCSRICFWEEGMAAKPKPKVKYLYKVYIWARHQSESQHGSSSLPTSWSQNFTYRASRGYPVTLRKPDWTDIAFTG